MKDRRGYSRYQSPREKRDYFGDRRMGGRSYREETSTLHPRTFDHNCGDWGRSGRSDQAPSSRDPWSRPSDVRDGKETGHGGWCEGGSHVGASNIRTGGNSDWFPDTKGGQFVRDSKKMDTDGWGDALVDDRAPADVKSGWENIASCDTFDWSKPPYIESVDFWDDSGAKETWELVKSGHHPSEGPDLYEEKDMAWGLRTHVDLPTSGDAKRWNQKASTVRARSPVILGLESLLQEWERKALQTTIQAKAKKSQSNWSNEEQDKGEGPDWDAIECKLSPSGHRVNQSSHQQMSGIKRKADGFKYISGRDEYCRKPRYSSGYRY